MTYPAGVRKVLVAYDTEGYSRRTLRSQAATQSRVAELILNAIREVGLSDDAYEAQEEGDGGLLLLSTGHADEPQLIAGLIRSLEAGLGELNGDLAPEARIRLRVSLSAGVVRRSANGYAGDCVIEAIRLRDNEAIRGALRESEDDIVTAVTDALYREMLGHFGEELSFNSTEIQVKGFTTTAWIHLPRGTGERTVSGTPPVSPPTVHQPPSLQDKLSTNPSLW